MLDEYKALRSQCRPFLISANDKHTGPRIGGLPPTGVFPPKTVPSTRYLCTIPLGVLELSIFTSFNHADHGDVFWSSSMKLLPKENSVVQFVLHVPQERANIDSPLRSELKSYSLDISKESIVDNESIETIVAHHKIGGFPFYHQGEDIVGHESRLLLQNNWYHVLQLAFPSWRDADPGCSWPFCEYVFHVFAQEKSFGIDFKYAWG